MHSLYHTRSSNLFYLLGTIYSYLSNRLSHGYNHSLQFSPCNQSLQSVLAIQSLQFSPCNSVLQFSPCNSVLAISPCYQSLQSVFAISHCNSVLAIQSLQCSPCNAVLFQGLNAKTELQGLNSWNFGTNKTPYTPITSTQTTKAQSLLYTI